MFDPPFCPPLVEKSESRLFRFLLCELYDPQANLPTRIFPPEHFSLLLHWSNLVPLIAPLHPAARRYIETLEYLTDAAGVPVHLLPPIPYAEGVGIINSHLHLDTLLSKQKVSAHNMRGWFESVWEGLPALPVPIVGLVANFIYPWNWDRAEVIVHFSPFPTRTCFGVHPHHIDSVPLEFLEVRLQRVVGSPTCVGVGETGLDYTCRCRCPEPWDQHRDVFLLQEEYFRGHIRVAKSSRKVLVVHCRDDGTGWAGKRALQILVEEGATDLPIHRHCFLGDKGEAEEWSATLENIKFSFPCIAPEISRLQAVVSSLPLTQILIETDAPHLRPKDSLPPNHPGNLGQLLQWIADVRNMPLKLMALAIQLNTTKFYRVGPRV